MENGMIKEQLGLLPINEDRIGPVLSPEQMRLLSENAEPRVALIHERLIREEIDSGVALQETKKVYTEELEKILAQKNEQVSSESEG